MSAGILCRWMASQGRWDDALLAYQDFNLQNEEKLVWVWFEMAKIADQMENDEEALAYVFQAISRQSRPDCVPLLCPQDIIDMYKLKRNKLITMQRYNESHAQAMQRYQEAVELTEKIHSLVQEKDKVDEIHMLAQLYLLMEDYATARKYLRDPDVMEKFANTMEYIAKRELIRVRLDDDLQNTLDAYTQALSQNPTNVPLLMKRFFLCVYHIPFQEYTNTDYQTLLQCGYNMKDVMSRVGSI